MPDVIEQLKNWVEENYNAPACEWTYERSEGIMHLLANGLMNVQKVTHLIVLKTGLNVAQVSQHLRLVKF